MSAQLMALVRELKALNSRRKGGETLTEMEEARRTELKVFLKMQIEGGAAEASITAARPVSGTPAAAPTDQRPPPSSSSSSSSSPPARFVAPSAPAASGSSSAAAAPVAPKPAPPPYVPRKDQFAIGGSAAKLIEDAMNSAAVSKVDPWGHLKAHANQSEITAAEAAADAAIQETKKRERASTHEEVMVQIKETQGGYTPPADDYCQEQYYGGYFGEGLSIAGVSEAVDLRPVDPREIEALRAIDVAAGPSGGRTSLAVPSGLGFLDDFVALYSKRILPPPADDVSYEIEDPTMLIGKRKVTVHLLNGERKQGAIKALRRGELGFRLDVGSGGEDIAISQVKAVFVHLQGNAQAREGHGRTVTVTFSDQRAVQGDTEDYAPGVSVFTLIPPAGRGQFEKIIINCAAVASVS